jgi:hypothetical protein
MKSIFRYGTRKAIDLLAKNLKLPNEKWMQDWPYEVVNSMDIEKYITHYNSLIDEDEKFVLMRGIIQANEEQTTEELFIKYWNKIKPILEQDFEIHKYTIHYWCCLDEESLENC